jgi:AraC-like DNA-binding protein
MEALQRLRRYESIVNSNLTITLVETEQRVDVLSDANITVKEVSKIHEDIRKSVVLDLCRKGLEADLNPIEVAFTYPEPEDTSEYAAIFRCPLAFSQPVSRLSFSVDDTRRAFLTSNREIALGNDQILDSMLSELKGSSLASQVKHVIIECLPSGSPTEKDIVERLSMSGRTLQRKLSDEGTTFRTLLLEARRALAEQYIADKNMPLAEISYMLGFSEQSAFFRAFKKWTGDSPSQFRDSLG